LKILHLTRDLPPHSTGGLANAVGGLVHACHCAGLDCTVLSFDSWRPRARQQAPAEAQMVSCDGLPVWRLRAPGQVETVLAEVSRARPDIVHVHDGILWEPVQALRQQLAGVAVCVTTHVLHKELNRLRGVTQPTMSLSGQEAVLAMADAVIAPSRTAASLLADEDPTIRSRLHCIGLGYDGPGPRQLDPGLVPLALYSGRFSDVKGTGELLTAVPRLLADCDTLRVVIAGGNPESPKTERRWLRRLVSAVPVTGLHRLIFTGWISRQALASVLGRASIQLVPSWFETFGLSALEALGRGVPVVGTTGGALPELVEHERTGLLSPPGDVDALVANALRLLTDTRLCQEMGAAATEQVRNRFTWKRVVTAHTRLYRSLLCRTS
jgi:glycosyltransferase involved in cell wall biosynthesis